MKLLPRTLFGQIVLALLIGIVAAQAFGAWLMLDERTRLAQHLLGSHAAQRIAGIIDALDSADAAERARLVHALNLPPTRIRLDEPWRASVAEPDEEVAAFADEVRIALSHPVEIQVLSLRGEAFGGPWLWLLGNRRSPASGEEHARDGAAKDGDGDAPLPPRPRMLIRAELQARLGDGTVVTFHHALPGPPIDEPLRVLGWIGVILAIVTTLALWIVRRLTQPLRALAVAASGLSADLDQPPLPESGPSEVASAARAFNAMQRDLRRMIETRTTALAAVSHDLRLPLTRLRLRIESLRDASLRNAIESDVADMERMVENTLQFLRAGKTNERPVMLDLNALLERIVEDVEVLGAEVDLHGRAQAPLLARPGAIERCLANLIDNARRYAGPRVDVTVKDAPGQVEIRVEDRGPGIVASECERVFEPYVRLESSRAKETGGTGLGLAIARAVARLHGGDLKLEARVGGGLSAVLTLARVPAAA
jgi:signal transduction histidine kinase